MTIMTYPFRTIIGMLAGVVLLASATAFAQSADKSPCSSRPRLLFGNVGGRIDHMAVDSSGNDCSSPNLAMTRSASSISQIAV